MEEQVSSQILRSERFSDDLLFVWTVLNSTEGCIEYCSQYFGEPKTIELIRLPVRLVTVAHVLETREFQQNAPTRENGETTQRRLKVAILLKSF